MKYEISFTTKDDEGKIKEYAFIEGIDLVQVVSQIPLMIAHAVRQEKEEQRNYYEKQIRRLNIDDDIPF